MKEFLKKSLQASRRTSWVILKLVFPIYLLVDCLDYLGVLAKIAFIFAPITNLLDLPSQAALALAGGVLFNMYAGIAFAAPLGLNAHQWTVVGVFIGICHSLMIETAVLSRLKMRPSVCVGVRLASAFLCALLVSRLPAHWFGEAQAANVVTQRPTYDSFIIMLIESAKNASLLALKIVLLISAIIVLFDLLKASSLYKRWVKSGGSVVCLLIGFSLGVTYGAGLLLKEAEETGMPEQSLLRVSSFLLLAHGIFEETALFVIFGASGLTIILCRMASALMFTGVVMYFQKRFSHQAQTILMTRQVVPGNLAQQTPSIDA